MGRARVVRVDPAVVEQLARIGNNLNQLARWANTERRYVADLAQLQLLGRELAALRAALPTSPDDLDDDGGLELDDEVLVVDLQADRRVPR